MHKYNKCTKSYKNYFNQVSFLKSWRQCLPFLTIFLSPAPPPPSTSFLHLLPAGQHLYNHRYQKQRGIEILLIGEKSLSSSSLLLEPSGLILPSLLGVGRRFWKRPLRLDWWTPFETAIFHFDKNQSASLKV